MKKIISLFILLIVIINTQAQNVGVGTNTPSQKAILEVASSNKGFLPPRLFEDSILAMGVVEAGMVVYNKTRDCLMIFNGTKWQCTGGGSRSNSFELDALSFYAGADSCTSSSINSITSLSNGEYCVTGTFTGAKMDLGNGKVLNALPSSNNGFVAKYAGTGVCQWAVKLLSLNTTTTIEPLSIDAAGSGSVFITGRFNDSMALFNANGSFFNKLSNDVAGDMDIFMLKINADGDIGWRRREGNSGGIDEGHVIKTIGNLVFIAGQFHGSQNFGTGTPFPLTVYGGLDGFYARYDTATGTVCSYAMKLGGVGDDDVLDIYTGGGSIYLTGSYETSFLTLPANIASLGGKDMFIAKYPVGISNASWVECARGTGFETGSAIDVQGTDLFVAGFFSSASISFTNGFPVQSNNGNIDGMVLKVPAFSGAPTITSWIKTLGGSDNDIINDLAVSNSGTCTVVGHFSNYLRFHNNYPIYATGAQDGFMASFINATGDLYKVAKAASLYNDACNALVIKANNDITIGGYSGQPLNLNGTEINKPLSSNGQALLWILK